LIEGARSIVNAGPVIELDVRGDPLSAKDGTDSKRGSLFVPGELGRGLLHRLDLRQKI
jgi:hypothetical protein